MTMAAFDLAFDYRSPVIVLTDGYVAQMTGKVRLPAHAIRPGLPEWAVSGDAGHRGNVISSIYLSESELEDQNRRLLDKYARIGRAEQRADLFCADDADVLLVACNTPARMCKGAVSGLRAHGIKAGLFRPLTLWPFPIVASAPLLARARRVIVVEASAGQLEDELRLSMSRAGLTTVAPIERVNRYGGVIPSQEEIVEAVMNGESASVRGVCA